MPRGRVSDVDPVARWLLEATRPIADSAELLGAFANRLLATGFPLARLYVGMRTLHPQVLAISLLWRVGDGRHRGDAARPRHDRDRDLAEQPDAPIYEQRVDELRRRADENRAAALELPDPEELRAEGMTDYLLLPLRFSRRLRSTRSPSRPHRPGGFSEAEIAAIPELLPLLAARARVPRGQAPSPRTLLSTYLGREAGRRVLAGQVRRGDGPDIAAALCLLRSARFHADERGAAARPSSSRMLNEYFATMAAPVEEHGGEVLKFIGDAMLAIFPIADDLDRDRACLHRARRRARRRSSALDELNRGGGRRGEAMDRRPASRCIPAPSCTAISARPTASTSR